MATGLKRCEANWWKGGEILQKSISVDGDDWDVPGAGRTVLRNQKKPHQLYQLDNLSMGRPVCSNDYVRPGPRGRGFAPGGSATAGWQHAWSCAGATASAPQRWD